MFYREFGAMTAFRRSNSTDLREIADGIVRHLDRVPAGASGSSGHDVSNEPLGAAGNAEYSGRWTKGSAPGEMEEITISGRRNGRGILSDETLRASFTMKPDHFAGLGCTMRA